MQKSFFLLAALILCCAAAHSQVSKLDFNDTRNVSYPPDSFRFETRFDFKDRTIIGAPGWGEWSGLMTVAPWGDASGGRVHQLNFNDAGLYYRQGTMGVGWHQWQQVLTDRTSLFVRNSSDAAATLFDEKTSGWQYIQFLRAAGRLAYLGITPANDFVITKEAGGNIILDGGNVGIGTFSPGSYKLAVAGTIGARRVKVTQESWPDYVFKPGYAVPSLYDVEKYVKTHQHLPDVPAEKEVLAGGVDLGEMNKVLLQKIEEMTLYLIEHRKELDALKADNKALKETISKLSR